MATSTRNEARAALKHGAKAVREIPVSARAAASEIMDQTRGEMSECIRSAGASMLDLAGKAGESIRRDPIRAVLLGVGVGCLLGLCVRRRQ